jgi:ATP-dependent Clp protease protease subunit
MWIHGIHDYYTSGEEGEPGVEYMMATTVIKNLQILMHYSEKDPITIHLHTCGGDYGEGMAIYDMIKSLPCYVYMINYTHARSMSSIILQSADYRVMMPNSYFMYHMGDLSIGGTYTQVMSSIEFTKKVENVMFDIYVEKMKKSKKFKNKSKKELTKMLYGSMNKKEEVYLTAQEAVEWGFADTVFSSWDSIDCQ